MVSHEVRVGVLGLADIKMARSVGDVVCVLIIPMAVGA